MVLYLVFAALLLGGCGNDLKGMDSISTCSESITQRLPSPNGNIVATLFERNCGATTGFVTHINLRLSTHADRPDNHGVVSVGQVLIANGQPQIRMEWEGDNTVVVRMRKQDVPDLVSHQEHWESVLVRLQN
jgi:hypothetical protein